MRCGETPASGEFSRFIQSPDVYCNGLLRGLFGGKSRFGSYVRQASEPIPPGSCEHRLPRWIAELIFVSAIYFVERSARKTRQPSARTLGTAVSSRPAARPRYANACVACGAPAPAKGQPV